MTMPLSNVVVHHTVMGDGNCSSVPECILVMQEIQDFHMDDRGWSDIGYRYFLLYHRVQSNHSYTFT